MKWNPATPMKINASSARKMIFRLNRAFTAAILARCAGKRKKNALPAQEGRVIPEIDTPGHTNAALASYPELNCNDTAPDLYTGIEVGFSSLCIAKPITYELLGDVFSELAAPTPGAP